MERERERERERHGGGGGGRQRIRCALIQRRFKTFLAHIRS